MIEEVEAGNVSTIIVKDMSRFGRDYLKVGFFTEVLFSEKDVRLIAVNDNIDTQRGENDFAPMMNRFNEWFVRSTSKKIRAVWQAKTFPVWFFTFHTTKKQGKKSASQWRISFPAGTLCTMV